MTTTIAPDSSVRAYAAALAMPFDVVRSWADCEGQYTSVPTNIMNIRPGNTPGQTGAVGPIATYASVAEGARWTAWLINHGPYAGVRAARAAHVGSYELARAIERSPWAGSNYGSSDTRDGCIARQIPKSAPVPVPPTPTPPTPTPHFRVVADGATVDVKGGQTIYLPDANTEYSHTKAGDPTTFPMEARAPGWVLLNDGGIFAAVPDSAVAATHGGSV